MVAGQQRLRRDRPGAPRSARSASRPAPRERQTGRDARLTTPRLRFPTIPAPTAVACRRGGGRLPKGCDTGQEDVGAGEELFAVVVLAQLCRRLVHERVLTGVELLPLCGD